MFVCNLKINKKKFVFLFTSLILVLAILLMFLAFNKIFINTYDEPSISSLAKSILEELELSTLEKDDSSQEK